ncbi:unnamed protein product [Closterium sp. Yama58-4]|nr:unnamed protein product [Closterium sp. Yama58-4]
MSTTAFEPLRAAEEPLRDPAAAAEPCHPFAAPTVEREMGAQCRVPTAEECSDGKSPAEAQSDVGGRSPGRAASAESGESADELLLLDWIIDGSCSTDDLMLRRTATDDSRIAGATDSFASPSAGIRGTLSHSPLRASASDRNLGGLCGDSRNGKREFRRSCSMEDINSGGASGGGGRGGKPGNRILVESSPSSVLTGGPSSPATSVDSCASDLTSPISSPVIMERISMAKPRTLHLPPLPPKAPVLSDSTWRPVPAISVPASCAPPTAQIQPSHHIRSFGAPQHAVPSAFSLRLQQQQRESQQEQVAQAAAAKQHPLLALDEQRRKHRAWMSLFSPSLAQTLPPLAPSENGAELKRLAELRAQAPSAAYAEAEAEQRAEGDCAREINAAAEVAVSAFRAEFPPFSIPAANDGQPGVTSSWVANENSSDELAGDVTQAIRQGLGSVKLGSAAGSSSGQQQNFSRSFSYDVISQAGGLPNCTSGIRRTSSDVGEAPADPRNVHITRSGTCGNGSVILTKPSNLRRGGMAKQVQGQKKVRWGANEVFEIPARCSSIDF